MIQKQSEKIEYMEKETKKLSQHNAKKEEKGVNTEEKKKKRKGEGWLEEKKKESERQIKIQDKRYKAIDRKTLF